MSATEGSQLGSLLSGILGHLSGKADEAAPRKAGKPESIAAPSKLSGGDADDFDGSAKRSKSA